MHQQVARGGSLACGFPLDRDKYQQVGEADNFLLKFRKVE
jgi:hypothetical protein